MNLDVMYVVAFVAGAVLGGWISFTVGKRIGQFNFFSTALRVKNPEMWELLHYYVIDETETQKIRRRREHGGSQ